MKYFDFPYWHFQFFCLFMFFWGYQLHFLFFPSSKDVKNPQWSSLSWKFWDLLFSSVGKKRKNLSNLWKISLSLFGISNYTPWIVVVHKISLILILGFYRWGKCFLIFVWYSVRLHQPVAKKGEKRTHHCFSYLLFPVSTPAIFRSASKPTRCQNIH